MKFASLGSGSKGNAWVVQAGRTHVLVDCGFSAREAARRLAGLGLTPAMLDGVLVTHEHGDHARGAALLAARAGCPLWASRGTLDMLARLDPPPAVSRPLTGGQAVHIGDLEITPFTIPHDCREPLHFTYGDGAVRFGMVTDAGHVSPEMAAALSGCDALVLECNHDIELLRAGRYPAALKQRILGPKGHLDNQAAAGLLAQVKAPNLQHVVAAHLSAANNTPQLARAALAGALGCEDQWIGVANQETGLMWREIN